MWWYVSFLILGIHLQEHLKDLDGASRPHRAMSEIFISHNRYLALVLDN
jgi:hypothetical protein